jgi:pyruvate/2-oxoglutarate dehydrogenase complex dihydrolipoamide dehydrogenase (E3) component
MEGLTVLHGHARFQDARTIRIGMEALTAPRIILNVGARTLVPAIPGIDRVDHLNSSSIIELETLPEHLLVVGGSYIGLEFAQMYRRFGAEVTVAERGPRLLPREDEDVSEAIRDILEAEGITVHTDAACIGLAPHPEGIALHLEGGGGEPAAIGSHVLVATGRRPNTDGLSLDVAGIASDARGYITVDDTLATNVPGIWALGDCNGRGAFTHTAYNDFEILAANLLDGESRRVSQRVPAYALYIDPPLGRVGMTDAQAKATGKKLLFSKRPMARVGRAIEKGETQGFMKVVADAETQQILGAAILGVEGDEAIHGLLDAMHTGTPSPVLRWAVPIHPTVSELIPTLLGGLAPEKD